MILIAAGSFIFVIWFYILFVREWALSRWPDQLGTLHKIEDDLWAKSRTILIARGYWIGGVLIGLQTLIAGSGVDITPFVTALANFIPEQYRGLAISLFMILTGLAFEWLRRTHKPVDSLDGD